MSDRCEVEFASYIKDFGVSSFNLQCISSTSLFFQTKGIRFGLFDPMFTHRYSHSVIVL